MVAATTDQRLCLISIDVEPQNYYQHIISYFTSKHSVSLGEVKASSTYTYLHYVSKTVICLWHTETT